MSLDDIRKELTGDRKNEIVVDKPQVKVFEMQVNALLKLADEKNEIFSEITRSESIDLTIMSLFGKNPLPSVNERLQERGIDFQITLPILDKYITEVLRHRHKIDRKRVDEYLKALATLQMAQMPIRLQDERPPLMRRLV